MKQVMKQLIESTRLRSDAFFLLLSVLIVLANVYGEPSTNTFNDIATVLLTILGSIGAVVYITLIGFRIYFYLHNQSTLGD